MPSFLKKMAYKIKKILSYFKNEIKNLKNRTSGLKKIELNILKQKDLDKKLVFSIRKRFFFPRIQQLKMLPSVLSAKEKKIVKFLIAISLISFLFWGWRFYNTHLGLVPTQGGDYTEGVIGGPKYINPLLSQTADVDKDLSALIFSGLLKYDSNQKIAPDLAEKYEISQDQKNYTFYLKDKLWWQDEEKLNADDIIFTIQDIKNRDFKSPLWSSFNAVEVEKLDDKTIKFKLTEPYSPFLSLLSVGILPRHMWEDIEPATAGLADYNLTSPIGSGPFKAKSFVKDKSGKIKSYTLERNENYYGQKPYLDKITFAFFDSKEDAFLALKNKTIEGLSFLTFEQKEELAKKESLNFYTLKIPQYTALFINQKNNLLKNKNFRQALAYSLDKEKIVSQNLAGNAELIKGPILPGFVGYKEDLKIYEYDPAKAKKAIESLGWQKLKPEDKFYKKKVGKEETELKLTLTIINKELNQRLAQAIKNYWEDVGVKIEIKPIESAEAQEKIFHAHDYEILLYGENLGLDADLYPFWHSSQIAGSGFNLSQLANKEADKILEEARATTDLKARHDKYVYFQNILTEEIPAVFLYRPVYYYAVDKKIKGLNLDNIYIADSPDRFNGIENWYIKTEKKLKLGE